MTYQVVPFSTLCQLSTNILNHYKEAKIELSAAGISKRVRCRDSVVQSQRHMATFSTFHEIAFFCFLKLIFIYKCIKNVNEVIHLAVIHEMLNEFVHNGLLTVFWLAKNYFWKYCNFFANYLSNQLRIHLNEMEIFFENFFRIWKTFPL